jgi:hypothetical protein
MQWLRSLSAVPVLGFLRVPCRNTGVVQQLDKSGNIEVKLNDNGNTVLWNLRDIDIWTTGIAAQATLPSRGRWSGPPCRWTPAITGFTNC